MQSSKEKSSGSTARPHVRWLETCSQTTEFNLQMRIEFTLTDRVTGKQLAKRTVIGTTSFFVGADVQQDEQQALPLAAEKAAVQIVTSVSEGW